MINLVKEQGKGKKGRNNDVSYYCYGKTQEFIMVVFVIGP
jgi:hypothetical protein